MDERLEVNRSGELMSITSVAVTATALQNISNEIGLVHHTIRLASTTLESFQDINDTCAAAVQMLPSGEQIYLIYDNARPHINIMFANIAMKSTPTYSRHHSLILWRCATRHSRQV